MVVEKYDLDKMLVEVKQDEEFDRSQSSPRVSQADIKRMLQEKKKAQRKE